MVDNTRTGIREFTFSIRPWVYMDRMAEWQVSITINGKKFLYTEMFPRIPSHLSEADMYFRAAADAYRKACEEAGNPS